MSCFLDISKKTVLFFLFLYFYSYAYSIRQENQSDQIPYRVSLDDDWRFRLEKTNAKEDVEYDIRKLDVKIQELDKYIESKNKYEWKNIDLPHDWAIMLPYEKSDDKMTMFHGYKPIGRLYPENSIGWYKKEFIIEAKDSLKHFSITFDGVYRDSKLWVNGIYIGSQFSGYNSFSFDITDFLRFGEKNIIEMRVDASLFEGWWYEGAGIYRHVWLDVYHPVHFKEHSIFIYSEIKEPYKNAVLKIESEIHSKSPERSNITVINTLKNRNGETVSVNRSKATLIEEQGYVKLNSEINVSNPFLWSIESPYLYRVVSEIEKDRVIIDRKITKIGIRDIRVSAEEGLFINGKNVKVKGVCMHQDHPGVGIAIPDELHYYRIKLLKEMGANAYRTAHHAHSPVVMEACDSLGMIVLDETRLVNSGKEYLDQLEKLVLRDRNHPSVFTWCIGNEENFIQTSRQGRRIAASMLAAIKKLDPTRPVTYGSNDSEAHLGINQMMPVRGFNYSVHNIEGYHKRYPHQPIIATEVASTVTARGIYRPDRVIDFTRDTVGTYILDFEGGYVNDFDEIYPGYGIWSTSTAEQWWALAASKPYIMGGFVWTGMDYKGEPTPFEWPNIGSNFGVMDACGFPKNLYHYYQTWWKDEDKLHIAPHWNWQGMEGRNIRVWVNSNMDQVELFLNNKSLGKKEMPKNGHLTWNVRYNPGTLKAIGYKNGRKIHSQVETTGEPYQITLHPHKNSIRADGKDLCIVNVEIKDKKGRVVPMTNSRLDFVLDGKATLLGGGNGDPRDHEKDLSGDGINYSKKVFNSKCQIIVQAGYESDEINLRVTGKGLEGTEISIDQKK